MRKNWMYATSSEIDKMTYDEAKQIILKQIALGHSKEDFRPREHLTKALEIVLTQAEAQVTESNQNIKSNNTQTTTDKKNGVHFRDK